jgi:predicted AAA+ superfamily ATPase
VRGRFSELAGADFPSYPLVFSELADILPSEAFIERSIAPVVVDAMQSARAVALLGARQAGKSTLARVLAGGPMPADYVTLDSDPVRAAARADPEGFVAALGRSTVIDEVQRAPDLLLAVTDSFYSLAPRTSAESRQSPTRSLDASTT